MNGLHHEDLTRVACHLAGIHGAHADRLIAASSEPDRLNDVRCHVPFEGEQPEVFGRQLTSLQHFQRADGSGYCWDLDPSLGALDTLGDVAMTMAGLTVSGTSPQMLRACLDQKGATLDDFQFPSAAQVGSQYEADRRPGYVLHFVQDACVPHHAWGCLLWGHAEFETALERAWVQHRQMITLASDPVRCLREFRAEVDAVQPQASSISDLIARNATWAQFYFGSPRRYEECSVTDMLAVCVRAVASSRHALRLMGCL